MGAALLGPVGGLERVAATTSEPVGSEPRVLTTRAISGAVRAQILPRARRVWECTESTVTPEDAAVLEMLSQHLQYGGTSGYVWYSSYAQVTNLLTPDESALLGSSWSGGVVGGAGRTADGNRFLVSRNAGAGIAVTLTDRLAVPAERPVTASVYVSAHPGDEARVQVREWDAAGLVVDTHVHVVPAGSVSQRAVVSFTTSLRTVSLSFDVFSPLMVALPAVTLTAAVQPWASGRGCRNALVNLTGEDPQLAFESATHYGRRASRSFTIHELG
jgi:hypothetical protein